MSHPPHAGPLGTGDMSWPVGHASRRSGGVCLTLEGPFLCVSLVGCWSPLITAASAACPEPGPPGEKADSAQTLCGVPAVSPEASRGHSAAGLLPVLSARLSRVQGLPTPQLHREARGSSLGRFTTFQVPLTAVHRGSALPPRPCCGLSAGCVPPSCDSVGLPSPCCPHGALAPSSVAP